MGGPQQMAPDLEEILHNALDRGEPLERLCQVAEERALLSPGVERPGSVSRRRSPHPRSGTSAL